MRRSSTPRLAPAAAVLALTIYGPATAPAAAAGPTPAACERSAGRDLLLTTVPRVRGFVFRVGNRRYRTNRSGTVAIAPVICADPRAAISALTQSVDQGKHMTATFETWYGTEALAGGGGDGLIYATFKQQVHVGLKLEDLEGRPVPRATVGTIVLKGSTGGEVVVPPGTSYTTLDASRVVRLSNNLVSKDIAWSVQRADVQGNTAVNRGQIRFEPRQTRILTVPLLLFQLRVEVRDALLRRSVGEQVVLSTPDGSTRTLQLDSAGEGQTSPLSRGHYVLRAGGAWIAMAFEQPVAVSRSQVAELRVISYVDVAIVASALLTTMIGLLLVGRRLHDGGKRRARARRLRRRQEAAP